MAKHYLAEASTTINAPRKEVWNALTDPAVIREYMFGAKVQTEWKEGSTITWVGEWKGKPYEDKGRILEIEPQKRLSYSHYSPLSGEDDSPENYHTVTIEISGSGEETHVQLTQDNNNSEEEQQHSEENWNAMLKEMKSVVEKQHT